MLRSQRSVSFALRLGLLFAGCAVGMLLAEALLRVLGVSYPPAYTPDPYCGSRLCPGFSAWFSKEGRAYVTINRAGFRDREHTVEKPPNTVRIAVLGDSFAEALQVPLEKTFWSVLQEELGRRRTFGAERVEVLNFGISGFGTASELQMLRYHVWPYKPDIILLAFCIGNDVRNNSPELEPTRTRPFFAVAPGGRLVLDDSFQRHPDYLKANSRWVRFKVALIRRSRLLQLAHEWRIRLRDWRNAPRSQGAPVDDNQVFREPTDDRWRHAWEITERLIEQMQQETTDRGAAFWLAMIGQDIQVHPDPLVRRESQHRLGVADFRYPERRIAALGQRRGFPVITLSDRMLRHAEQHRTYLHGFATGALGEGHWNESGHKLAGMLIAEAMSSQNVSRSSSQQDSASRDRSSP